MGQALNFCRDCENKLGCSDCIHLHKWIVGRLARDPVPCSECVHAGKGDHEFCDQTVTEYKWNGSGFDRKIHKLESCSYGKRK